MFDQCDEDTQLAARGQAECGMTEITPDNSSDAGAEDAVAGYVVKDVGREE